VNQIICKLISGYPSLVVLSHDTKLLLKELNHLLHIAAVLGRTLYKWVRNEKLESGTECLRNHEMAVEAIVHATCRQDRAILAPLLLQKPIVLIGRLVGPKPHVDNQ
jgi:hypothetical protein